MARWLKGRTVEAEKADGASHALPTVLSARYIGVRRVGTSMKTCTCRRIPTPDARVTVGEYCSRPCAPEGFSGYKEQAGIRARRHSKVAA